MSNRRKFLENAVRDLAAINGLYTAQDLATYVSLGNVSGQPETSQRPYLININKPEETEIMKALLDTADGSLFVIDLVSRLDELSLNDQDLRERLTRTLEIYHTKETQQKYYGETDKSSILEVLGYGQGGSGETIINSSEPKKTSPSLSVLLSNTHRVSLSNKNINPCVLFLNAIPNVELARSTPFVDINLYISKPPKNERTKQAQTISLPRFLLGAQPVDDNSPLDAMVSGNAIEGSSASANPISDIYTVAGMEMFVSPQTLVNADSPVDPSVRSNAVLDKFRPFMSLNALTINVAPTTGVMSFKTGTMELILHDRSRLSEVADFIRPDLYGTNEISIEYGWIHPDGESSSNTRNPYGDLINGMRLKEKYMIVNSSFSLTDTGSVLISLQIAMRGGPEMSTEIISSDAESTNSILKEIENLQRVVAEHRARAFGDGRGYQTREIRGIQILDAAQDAANYTNFSKDLREALVEFKADAAKTSNPSVQKIIDTIEQLYGEVNNRKRTNYRASGKTSDGKESLQTQLRTSIIESMQRKISKLATTDDPFYLPASDRSNMNKNIGKRNVEPGTWKEERQAREIRSLYSPPRGFKAGSSSMAKLMLLFVGEPLANTQKFDDIQFVFYPFNSYAGKASQINIGNFVVDNEFFAESFVRWRLETIGRSANLNLKDFMNFVISTIVEDPAAPSYGLRDNKGSLFKRTIIDDNGGTVGTETVDNPMAHNDRINQILQGITPDGSFKMPQVEFYLECSPRKRISREGEVVSDDDGQTVLKIHIFDRQASSYDTVGSLLANARDSEIAAVGSIPAAPSPAPGTTVDMVNAEVNESRARLHALFLETAEAFGVIQKVEKSDGPSSSTQSSSENEKESTTWRIVGGTQRLKEFMYGTMPYIIYGTAGSTVINANLSSMQDAALSTVNLLRSFSRTELEPNGENPGGLPMRIIPTELNLVSYGCPLLEFAQQFFVDFNTGTTADNIYYVTGLSHKIVPGSFTTDIKFAPGDAYGKYESVISRARTAQRVLEDIEQDRKDRERVQN